jgi:hypothetical protein
VLGYYAESNGNILKTFRDNPSGPIFKRQEAKKNFVFLTLEDGTNKFYQNVGKILPLLAA